MLVYVGSHSFVVDLDFVQALAGLIESLDSITKDEAEVAEQRRVRKIALHATTGKLIGEGIAEPGEDLDVAFGVLESDRIHFVRHGRGADFGGDNLLSEVIATNVTPHVLIEVADDLHQELKIIKQAGNVVVGLDLGSVVEWLKEGVERLDKGDGNAAPAQIGVGSDGGSIIASSAVELAEDFDAFKITELEADAGKENPQFLTKSGRSGGLAVGVCEHGSVGFLDSQFAEPRDNRLELFLDDALAFK